MVIKVIASNIGKYPKKTVDLKLYSCENILARVDINLAKYIMELKDERTNY